ncbi:MAG: hypothetical protein V4573_17750 [Pseudomonadota bacterium]
MSSFTVADLYTLLLPWLLKAWVALHNPLTVIEIFSAACGMVGSLLVALKGKLAGQGWVLFALSNVGWIAFAYGNAHWFQLLQQVWFSITSAIGIFQYLIVPRVGSLFDSFSSTHLKP